MIYEGRRFFWPGVYIFCQRIHNNTYIFMYSFWCRICNTYHGICWTRQCITLSKLLSGVPATRRVQTRLQMKSSFVNLAKCGRRTENNVSENRDVEEVVGRVSCVTDWCNTKIQIDLFPLYIHIYKHLY